MRTVVLDTNVLLADPNTLLAYPDAEVLLPETVLGEIDKLKTSRADPELRFRGREVSRILFDLSETGNLLEGVDLPEGGRLRIAPLDNDAEMPEGLSTRNADDRILAVAHQACAAGCEGLTLVTNDLNMLLKAQAFGLTVERREDASDGSWAKRFIVRPFQRYKIPIAILAIAIAVFAGVVAFAFYSSSLVQPGTVVSGVPDEFRDQLSSENRALLDGLTALDADPNDVEAMQSVANAYYNLRDQTGNVAYTQRAISYYERYLAARPDDAAVRTDMAAMYFYSGTTDRAIQEITKVLETEPDHIQANFNLGIFYWRGRQDYEAAALQFSKVEALTRDGDVHAQLINEDAKTNLAAVITEAQEAGQPIDVPGGSI
ncbi:MAG: PIN domain-containing protein [Coriobacteriia bacterium]|nr:PIN domain-containing protein [Coriobacteriia bacterium]